ncbi:hypothetical protein BCR36DRAFT_412690 [Piromyces finnis]|uniref:Ketopantoate reductase N-terminal domain-containing protein n=1 Tax=Piromyces finnis TaxID=1754191 RepID=A0A1Y1VAG1_9FUNG|nr:hypothetical protein BCR36DRAFT_412690 [Piromyces finnis]|eukprot:ORX49724.1 hypothetical protein BCR36DRAFT_412690 [Piromyces finnis]
MGEEERQPEILVVGAGNIGRVYGYHLFKAGAKIHFYIREHNKQNLTKYPLRIHRLTSAFRFLNKSTTEKFSDYTITTDTDVASGNTPNLPEQLDYVVFAVPCNRLGEGDWLKTLISYLNNKYQKNVYYTSPIPDETSMQRIIDMGVDKSQIISGQTNICSYFAPLENQKFEPRGEECAKKDKEEDNLNKVIVYCTTIPEVYGKLTEEAKEATNAFINLLNKGGINAVNIDKDTQYGIICVMAAPFLAVCSMYNWDLFNLGRDINTVTLLTTALCETSQTVMKKTDNKCSFLVKAIPFVPSLLFSSILIFVHFISLYICSFDIEAFCHAHFKVKLGEQTDYFASVVRSDAEKYNVDITHFNKIMDNYHSFEKKSE